MRAWGTPSAVADSGVATLSRLDDDQARAALLRCCGSRAWVESMLAHRPFEDATSLLRVGERIWWGLSEDAWLDYRLEHDPRFRAPAQRLRELR